MTPRPDPETREAQRRIAEEKRARDFGKFLESLERGGRAMTAEKVLREREQEEWDVLRHARWYVSAYHPLTRTMANEQAELLAKIDAIAKAGRAT